MLMSYVVYENSDEVVYVYFIMSDIPFVSIPRVQMIFGIVTGTTSWPRLACLFMEESTGGGTFYVIVYKRCCNFLSFKVCKEMKS